MNYKVSLKYMIEEHKRSVFVFYVVILAVIALLFLGVSGFSITRNDSGVTSTQVSGLETSTACFLLVAGLYGFKETFGMLIQNSISRKTLFRARILFTLIFASIMACIDKIIYFILKLLSSLFGNIIHSTLFEQIYFHRSEQIGAAQMQWESFIFNLFMYLCLASIGYFIGILFYRMNKYGKIAIGAGIPIFFFMLLPIFDDIIFNGKIIYSILKFLDFSFGLTSSNPFHAIVTFLILFIACSLFSWCLIRKATIKKS